VKWTTGGHGRHVPAYLANLAKKKFRRPYLLKPDDQKVGMIELCRAAGQHVSLSEAIERVTGCDFIQERTRRPGQFCIIRRAVCVRQVLRGPGRALFHRTLHHMTRLARIWYLDAVEEEHHDQGQHDQGHQLAYRRTSANARTSTGVRILAQGELPPQDVWCDVSMCSRRTRLPAGTCASVTRPFSFGNSVGVGPVVGEETLARKPGDAFRVQDRRLRLFFNSQRKKTPISTICTSKKAVQDYHRAGL
jgi:hypothetical protein